MGRSNIGFVTPSDGRRIVKFLASWEPVDKVLVFDRDDRRCYYCGAFVELAEFSDGVVILEGTLDHVVPLSLGGSHSYANVVTCCLPCNSLKGNDAALVDISILLSLVV